MDHHHLWTALLETGKLSAVALFCVGTASVFGWLLALYWAFQPNPPIEIARDVTTKRRLLRMATFSSALIQRIEQRAARRDGARR